MEWNLEFQFHRILLESSNRTRPYTIFEKQNTINIIELYINSKYVLLLKSKKQIFLNKLLHSVLTVTLESVLCEFLDGDVDLDPLEELCPKRLNLLIFLENELINLRELDFSIFLFIQTCSFSKSFNLILNRVNSSLSSRFSRLSDA